MSRTRNQHNVQSIAGQQPVTLLLGGEVPDAAPQQKQPSLFTVVNNRLSGRWRPMILIGAILSVTLAAIGYISTGPVYVSTAALRVAPRLRVTLAPIYETSRMDHFAAFVATQEQLIQSRRVLENAVKIDEFRNIPWSGSHNAMLLLQEDLVIESDRQSELIYVSFESDNPIVSQIAVNAIVKSYYDIYAKTGSDDINTTLQELDEFQTQLRRDLRTSRSEFNRVLGRYETSDLKELQSIKLFRMTELQDEIAKAKIALKQLEKQPKNSGELSVGTLGPALARLEQFDPMLGQLRVMRDQAETEYGVIKGRFKETTNQYRRAKQNYESAQGLFQRRYVKSIEQWEKQQGISGDGDISLAAITVEGLAVRIESLKNQAATYRAQSKQLTKDLQMLDELRFNEQRIQEDLDRVLQRVQQLEMEESSVRSGRINIAQWGYLPLAPHHNTAYKRALAGAIGGFGISFGLFFLLGTLDRRAFSISQLHDGDEQSSAPCLGVLPDLSKGLADAESRDVAAHCVHQIRNQIEVSRLQRDGYALAITSPYQGDGKTSIAMSLGWSYAASGHRTLLIDCDMIGRSLTRQFGMVGCNGLKEAIQARSCNSLIRSLAAPGMSFLPVGCDTQFRSEMLRRADLEGLLDSVRAGFDMIIIDTGPMLGSLESTPVVAAADGVVVSIRRGRARTKLNEVLQRFAALDTPCLGVIFNCAVRTECDRYVSEASLAAAEDARPKSRSTRSNVSVVSTADHESSVLMRAMESASPLKSGTDQASDAA